MEIQRILEEKKILDSDALADVVRRVTKDGVSYDTALREANVPKEKRLEVLSAYYEVPSFTFSEEIEIPSQVLSSIPQDSAEHYQMIPLLLQDDVLTVGAIDPENLAMRDVLNFISVKNNLTYKLNVMVEEDVVEALKLYDTLSGEVEVALDVLEKELEDEVQKKEEEKTEQQKKDEDRLKEDAPVTKIVATILRYAVDGDASDIHIEPNGYKVLVRFRIDGVLRTSLELPMNVHNAVVARLKILSALRLDERRKPQDGRFGAVIDERKISFRVSILPTNHGEKVVMRILDSEKGVRSLEDTGITPHNLSLIREGIDEPYGIILISGPTGSGKSSTLYAMLSEVDRVKDNVLSLEDPVEYNIDGVSQSQMRPEIGYSFAEGLRAALRQDPDIIMVGEIRDKETAQLAIQAALTGHLVFSTIHTNNSIGVIPRLVDMGVDPYLIAPTLKVATAQRLVKKLCPGTGREEKVEGSIKMMFDKAFEGLPEQFRDRIPDAKSIMHPEPAPGCSTGMKGRTAITEVLRIDGEIEKLILSNASEQEIYNVARSKGFMSMKEDAIIKALDHVIPFEEVNKFGVATEEAATFDQTTQFVEDSQADIGAPVDNQSSITV